MRQSIASADVGDALALIRVVVRVRPATDTQTAKWLIRGGNSLSLLQEDTRKSVPVPVPGSTYMFGKSSVLIVEDPGNRSLVDPNHFDSFADQKDHVYPAEGSSENVYADIRDIVVSAMNGINGTIFAYGQTSSGKTFTMQGNEKQPGIIPLAIRDVFQHIVDTPEREFLLRVSYLEIYNEQIKDLFNPKNDNLKVHENPNRDIYVGELTEEIVCSPESVASWMSKGEANRHVGETNMNERSSRSHTIFRMVIESRDKDAEQPLNNRSSLAGAYKVSCLNLVDLAGSERVGHTGAEGIRLKEGGHINKSLLALGTVIGKLSDASGADRQHIPYRDSKLTRILQPSLGGNARTCIVCTVNPAAQFVEETLSTLKFATRAKTIRNRPEVNEDVSEQALLRKYRKEINSLKSQLDEFKSRDGSKGADDSMAELMRKQQMENEAEREKIKSNYELLKNMILNSSLLSGGQWNPKRKDANRRKTWFPGKTAYQDEDEESVFEASRTPVKALQGSAVANDADWFAANSKLKAKLETVLTQQEEQNAVLKELQCAFNAFRTSTLRLLESSPADLEKPFPDETPEIVALRHHLLSLHIEKDQMRLLHERALEDAQFLRTEILSVGEAYDELRRHREEAGINVAQLQQKLADSCDERKILVQKHNIAEETTVGLRETITQYKSRATELEDQLQRLQENGSIERERLAATEVQLDMVTDRLAAVTSELTHIKSTLQAQSADMEARESEVLSLQNQLHLRHLDSVKRDEEAKDAAEQISKLLLTNQELKTQMEENALEASECLAQQLLQEGVIADNNRLISDLSEQMVQLKTDNAVVEEQLTKSLNAKVEEAEYLRSAHAKLETSFQDLKVTNVETTRSFTHQLHLLQTANEQLQSEVEGARAQLEQAQRSKEDLHSALAMTSESLEQMQEVKVQVCSELAGTRGALELVQNTNEDLKSELASSRESLKREQGANEQLKFEVESTRETLEQTRRAKEQLELELDSTQRVLEKVRRANEEMTPQTLRLEQVEENCMRSENALMSAEATIRILKEELEMKSRDLQQLTNGLEEKIQEKLALEASLESLRLVNAQLSIDLSATVENVAKLRSQVRALEIEAHHWELRVESSEASFEEVERKLAESEAGRHVALANAQTVGEKLADSRRRVEELEISLTNLREDYSARSSSVHQDLLELEQQCHTLEIQEEKLTRENSDLSNARDSLAAKLEITLTHLHEAHLEKARVLSTLEDKELEIGALQSRVTILESSSSTSNEAALQAISSLETDKRKLVVELQEVHSTVCELEKANASLEQRIDELEEDAKAHVDREEALIQSRSSLQSQIRNLLEAGQSSQAELHGMKMECQLLCEKIADKELENKEWQSKLHTVEQQCLQIAEKLDHNNTMLLHSEEEKRQLLDVLGDTQLQFETIKVTHEDLLREHDKLKAEIHRVRQSNEQMISAQTVLNQTLAENLRCLQLQIAEMETARQSAEKNVQDSQQRVTSLERDFEQGRTMYFALQGDQKRTIEALESTREDLERLSDQLDSTRSQLEMERRKTSDEKSETNRLRLARCEALLSEITALEQQHQATIEESLEIDEKSAKEIERLNAVVQNLREENERLNRTVLEMEDLMKQMNNKIESLEEENRSCHSTMAEKYEQFNSQETTLRQVMEQEQSNCSAERISWAKTRQDLESKINELTHQLFEGEEAMMALELTTDKKVDEMRASNEELTRRLELITAREKLAVETARKFEGRHSISIDEFSKLKAQDESRWREELTRQMNKVKMLKLQVAAMEEKLTGKET
ncbi:hypothetical protein HDU93_009124 [Gonapodya sp. JEL0774]|nr:hypothetical protein HDU93_009124 [Gonapodya sp. JEL0774]